MVKANQPFFSSPKKFSMHKNLTLENSSSILGITLSSICLMLSSGMIPSVIQFFQKQALPLHVLVPIMTIFSLLKILNGTVMSYQSKKYHTTWIKMIRGNSTVLGFLFQCAYWVCQLAFLVSIFVLLQIEISFLVALFIWLSAFSIEYFLADKYIEYMVKNHIPMIVRKKFPTKP